MSMIDLLKKAGDSDLVIRNGVIDDMRSQRISTGYHRLFTIRWYKVYGHDVQHHSIPVSAFNEVARQVRGDGYADGDRVNILAELKTHRAGDIYTELKAIERAL